MKRTPGSEVEGWHNPKKTSRESMIRSRRTKFVVTNNVRSTNKDQYPAKSSVRMSSSLMPALASMSFMPDTMAGGPAL